MVHNWLIIKVPRLLSTSLADSEIIPKINYYYVQPYHVKTQQTRRCYLYVKILILEYLQTYHVSWFFVLKRKEPCVYFFIFSLLIKE